MMIISKKWILLLLCVGIIPIMAALILYPSSKAKAQCGALASGCKSCHELLGEDPVNSDGTGWHESHAFGDFCYVCHGGVSGSMDKISAHSGMVPPLSDIQGACATCHPDDMNELAQVYAAELGVVVGEGRPADQQPGSEAGESGSLDTERQRALLPQDTNELVVDSDHLIDYQQRYAEVVDGARPYNVGNVITGTLIFAIFMGGGAFVIYNERKLGELPIFQKKVELPTIQQEEIIQIEGVTPEVAALLPKIALLNPIGLHALQRLLENPDTASELFHSLSRLDPDLVNRVRGLDRQSRELLMAMSGN